MEEENNYKEFVPLKSMENQFGISKEGKVVNFKTGRTIRTYIGTDMYEHIVLILHGKRYRKRVHRLMAEAFFNNAKLLDHKNAIKSDNHFNNLQPLTQSQNIKKGYEENDYHNPHSGRGIWIVAENKESGEKQYFKSMRECERKTGVERHRIRHFLKGERNNWTKYNFYYDE